MKLGHVFHMYFSYRLHSSFPIHSVFQAFLIAFTSEFLPRQMYQYQYNWDLAGYVNFTLAWAPNGTLSEPCRLVTVLSL